MVVMVWLWCDVMLEEVQDEQVGPKRSVLVIGPHELLPMSYGQKCVSACVCAPNSHNINTNTTKRTKKKRRTEANEGAREEQNLLRIQYARITLSQA